MSQQTINVGSGELTGDGESIRSAFQKVNSNFTEIYTTGFGAGPTGPSGPAGPTGPQGGDFIENKSFFVDFNGTDTNDGRSRGYPLKTITRALSSATTGTTVFISPGIFIESYPMTVPKGVTVRGSGLRATTISPTTATNSNDGFLVDGETTLSDFNMTGQYWNTGTNTGYAIRVKSSATFTTRSPYIERITILNRGTVSTGTDGYGFASGDAGRGVLIDGADINSNSVEAALLFNEFTMIVPGSIGFHLKNGARVEMLTSFTYFADKAIWAESGTVGRYTTGKTRLRASGYNLGSITTGTVISQYNSTGTLLATGNIASFVQGQNLILLNGKVPGFQEYDPEAPGKTVNLVGNATYSTADYKFGVSSFKFDNNLGDVASTGYVSVSGGGDFNFLDNDATFELFFKPLSYGEDQHLLSTERYDIIYTFDRKIKFNYKDTYGNSVATLEQTGPYSTGSWHFVSVSRQNDQVYLHVNGTRNGIPAVNITGDFIGNPIYLGTRYSTFTYGFKGYIDNVRITKSVGRYNNDYAVTTSTLTADTNTVLMLEETAASSVKIIDNAVPKQNITFSTTATADYLTLVDYKEFGAEVRAIACANVYGNHGVYADGLGNLITLMSHNFSYVGSGANLDNDPDLVNQANEVVALNGAQVFYNTIDQGGDVRIGDFFKADQQRGRLTFNADELNLYGLTNISFNTNGGIIFGDGSVQTTSGTKSFSSILFVDPSGNNTTANGSMALPFQTIQAAHDYAQNSAESNISTNTHLIIQVNPGNYYENITISRPRTHLIGLAEGFSLATSIYGQITFLSTSTIPFNLNTYSLQGMNLVNTGTYGIRLTGSRGYRFFGKNINQTGSGSQSSALYADPTLPIRITLDDSTFYNLGSTSTQFDLRNSYNCVFNNITTFVNSSTFLNQRNSTIYIKNSEINCTENSLLAADVISGSLTIDNSVINVANSTATGIFVHSTSTVQLFNTRLLVGNTTGTLLAIDGLAGGSIVTQNLIFSTATNIGISTSLSHTKYVAADSVHQHILPAADLTYDLGSTSSQWRSLYVGTSTIYLGGTALSVSGGNLTVDGSPVSGGGGGSGSTLVNGTYTVSLTTTGNVVIPNIIRGTTPEGITLAANYTAYIVTDYGDNNRTWTFDGSSGETILPNGTIIGSDGNVNTIISVPGVTTGTFVDWAFEPNGKIVLPNLQSIDSSDPITLVVGTDDAKLTLDNFNQAALLQAKKSFVRNFYENDEANFSYTNVSGQGTISITLLENGLYLRTLLQRLADQLSGNLQFPYSYSNIQATVNPGAENIVTTVTNVIQGFGPNDYVMEVNQLPDPDPFTCTNITISYDYLNTIGVDVDKDMFGISTDNDDIIITSGRDINLQATDDLRLTAGSSLELELSQLDGQVNTDGLEIRVSNTLTTHSWMYRFDGVTQLPSGLTASPISNFVPVNGTVLQQTENEILQVVSKGLSGGMTVGWAENPFEPSKVAALTFNATAEQVRIATGSYTGTVNTWAFDQTGIFTTPQGAAIGPEGMGWLGFSNGVSELPVSIVNKNAAGMYFADIVLGANGSSGEIYFAVWNTQTVTSKVITINTAGYIVLPGGGVINGNDYDVEITANNDGASTFGSVNINTQGPPAIYTVVQQTSPYSPDTITTDIGSSPFIGNIVAGMTVTGSGIVVPTTVSGVTGPDIYGTYSITISPASGTGLNYTETYTFTSAGGVTNRNWEFNSLGELYLPQGGAIQETQVTNELWGTTTTSLTLVPAGAANGTQRLEIYSTGGGEGNHIHITSGDQNQTDLFLGNDTQYFAVAANGQNYIQARNGYASPNPGTSAGPGANVNIYAGNAGDNGGNVADGNSGGDVYIASGISSSGLGGDILLNTSSGPDGFGNIELSTDGGSSVWTFDKDKTLTFPSGGGIVFDSSATSYIYGVTGIEFANATTQTTAWTKAAASVQSTPPVSPVTGQLYYDTDDGRTYIYTGSAWIDSSPAAGSGVTSITAGTGTAVSTSTGAITIWNTGGGGNVLEETFETKNAVTGVTVHDCTTNRLFYLTNVNANFTPNFTNLNLASGEATSVSIVVVQTSTARSISGVQIAGTTTGVTLSWQGSVAAPSGNASRTEVFTFSVLCTGTNAYTVLGMMTSFGGV